MYRSYTRWSTIPRQSFYFWCPVASTNISECQKRIALSERYKSGDLTFSCMNGKPNYFHVELHVNTSLQEFA